MKPQQAKTMKRITILCAITASLCCVPATSQATLVVNGSFEDINNTFVDNGPPGSATDRTMNLGPLSTAITGWTVSQLPNRTDTIAWIGSGNPFGLTASEGNYFLDLSGWHTQPYGGVAASAAIITVPGQQYRVGFDLGSDYRYNSSSPAVEVKVTGNPASATFTAGTIVYSGTSMTVNRWESFSLLFTASGSSTTISFNGFAPPNGQNYVGLDNVSLVAVPEPTTFVAGGLLLLPFAASTLRKLRKSRTA